jgi:hypothetical protein
MIAEQRTIGVANGRSGGRGHDAATRREAIGLRESGWTLRAIVQVLARRGIHVHESTILYWTSETASERRRQHDRERMAQVNAARASFRWPGRPKTEAWLLGRMRVLERAGLSMAAIAKVVSIDHGLELSEHQVRYALSINRLPSMTRRAAEIAA